MLELTSLELHPTSVSVDYVAFFIHQPAVFVESETILRIKVWVTDVVRIEVVLVISEWQGYLALRVQLLVAEHSTASVAGSQDVAVPVTQVTLFVHFSAHLVDQVALLVGEKDDTTLFILVEYAHDVMLIESHVGGVLDSNASWVVTLVI